MLTWPHADIDWGERLTQVSPVFAEIGRAVTAHDAPLSVYCSRAQAAEVRSRLITAGAAAMAVAEASRSWRLKSPKLFTR